MNLLPNTAQLKKHGEKITLAIALIALIALGAYFALRVGKLRGDIRDAALPGKSRTVTVKPLDLAPYSNALAELAQPSDWATMPANPFLGWSTNIIVQTTTDTNQPPPVSVEPQFAYAGMTNRAFKLLFRAYAWDAEKQRAYNFQINLIDQNITFFVPEVGSKIADQYRDTGYRIAAFEQSITNVTGNVGPRTLDISRLTIQRSEEEPVLLTLNKITYQSDPIATLYIRGALAPTQLRRGDSFETDGRKYNVVDITPTQMIIVNTQSKENKPIVIPRVTTASRSW